MAHFARIDKNNIVQSVHVVDNENLLNEHGKEEEVFGIVYLNKVHGVGFTWVQTSYNSNFRKQYAGVGFTYDKTNDVFIAPQPFPSWTLNASFDWQPPTAMPDDGKFYSWNEDTTTWDEMDL
tara:strand:+ start:670 stop:1035 length:366 start_codon:yes stop_codon:yes gene_type:complete